MRSALRATVCAIAGGMLCFALDPAMAISQYHKTQWQVEEGLPRNYVMMVLPGPNGYLLIGTDEGVARFDGARFTPFPVNDLRLNDRWVLSAIRGSDDSLWLGTFDGWIYRVAEGRTTDRFDVGASVFALLQDGSGAIWASTRGGVMRRRTGGFDRVPQLDRPPDTAWNVLALDRSGAVWAVTIAGLFRYAGDSPVLVARSDGGKGQFLSIAADRRGGIWAGAASGVYRVYSDGSAPRLERESGIGGPAVALAMDRDGNLWAGTWGNGIYRKTSQNVAQWTARDGLADDFIRTLYEDREGDLWIGSRSGGLARWNDPPLAPHGVPEGLKGEFASTVVPDKAGNLWFGTWRGGLYRMRNGAFESMPTPVPTLYCTIRALAIDPAGNPWIGNWEGLYGFDGRRYHQFAVPGSPYYHVSALLFDRRGRLWVGTSDRGVFLFPAGRPSGGSRSFLPQAEVTSLLEDSAGAVWVGTNSGLGRFDDSENPTYSSVGNLPDGVTSVSEDSRRRICVTTLGGALAIFAGDKSRVLDAHNGLPGQPLYRAVDDRAGSLWISSSRGILQLRSTALDAVLDGRAREIDVALYDRSDGMRTVECHRISQPAGNLGPDGRVWFPTAKGFVAIDPRRTRAEAPPPVRVEGFTSDGREAAGGEARLPPGTHALEIRYTALHFSPPDKVEFRYRLDGFDPDWVKAGADRTARYSRIPPGRYHFHVSARVGFGEWGAAPAVLEIYQQPRFVETGWFAALCVVAAGLAVIGLFRWRLYLLRGRYGAVLAERNRISREWHDTLLAGFSAIRWQLEETLGRLERKARADDTVALALKMVEHYRAEARRVIWDLREDRPESETLADSIRHAVGQVIAGTAIALTVDVEGAAAPVAEEIERNLLRIAQEAATNAKRHGRATSIAIRIVYAPAAVVLTIRDDGTGFDVSAAAGLAEGHFGLSVMRERAQRFGGDVDIQSAPGAGTVVQAKIPNR